MLQVSENIIIKCIRKTASEEENRLLHEWLCKDKKHQELYYQMEEIWSSSRKIDEETIQNGWDRLSKEIERTQEKNTISPSQQKSGSLEWFRYVAAVFVGVLITSAAWFGLRSGKHSKQEWLVQHVVHNHTGVQQLLLPDGSEVFINENSKITYPEIFNGNQRIIQLTGNAFFSVRSNSGQPFVVRIGNVEVEVTGTDFFIHSATGLFTRVALISGGVKVNYSDERGKSSSVQLTPGQEADVDILKGEIKVTNTDTHFYTVWKDGCYQFDNEPLEEIVYLISRRFELDIQLSPSLKTKRFTGRINMYDNIQDILAIIHKSYPIQYEIMEKTIVIREK